MAIGNARNAGLLAVRILGTSDDKLRAAMERYQADLAQSVRDKDAKLAPTRFATHGDKECR